MKFLFVRGNQNLIDYCKTLGISIMRDDKCTESADGEVRASDLYKCYREWANFQGIKEKEQLSKTAFGRRLTDKYLKTHKKTGAFYAGLGLKGDGFDNKIEASDGLTPIFPVPSYINVLMSIKGKSTPNPSTRHLLENSDTLNETINNEEIDYGEEIK